MKSSFGLPEMIYLVVQNRTRRQDYRVYVYLAHKGTDNTVVFLISNDYPIVLHAFLCECCPNVVCGV